MRRVARLVVTGAVALSLAAGCSKRPHGAGHETEPQAQELPPPTPDTTPIEALRTPAGLVLGVEATPAPAGGAPVPTEPPTPLPAPVPDVTPAP